MLSQEHWDVLTQIGVSLLVINTALKVVGGIERYRFAVVWLERYIGKVALVLKPSDLAEAVAHIGASAFLLAFVAAVIAACLHVVTAVFKDFAPIRYGVAVVLLYPTVVFLLITLMMLYLLLVSWFIVIVSVPGLVLSLGSSVSGGRHLTFLSVLTSAAGFVLYVLKHQQNYVQFFIGTVLIAITVLEIALRRRERQQKCAADSPLRDDLWGSVACATIATLSTAALGGALWYYGWTVRRLLLG